MVQNERKNIAILFYTKILLSALYLILVLVRFDVPFSHSLFGIISATTSFIFSPILLIIILMSKDYSNTEKVFLITSFICISSMLLIGILWNMYEAKISLLYFFVSLFLLFASEFLYWKYFKSELKKDFIKAVYIQRLIIVPLIILVILLQ